MLVFKLEKGVAGRARKHHPVLSQYMANQVL